MWDRVFDPVRSAAPSQREFAQDQGDSRLTGQLEVNRNLRLDLNRLAI